MTTVHTKASIHELLDRSDQAVIRALHAIYARQTASEQAGHSTHVTNGVGFSRYDAPFLTDMVKAVRNWGRLTPKQMAITRNKMKRYHRQLVEIANSRPESTVIAEDLRSPATVSADQYKRLQSWCKCEDFDGERKCQRCLDLEFAAQEQRQEAAAFMGNPETGAF